MPYRMGRPAGAGGCAFSSAKGRVLRLQVHRGLAKPPCSRCWGRWIARIAGRSGWKRWLCIACAGWRRRISGGQVGFVFQLITAAQPDGVRERDGSAAALSPVGLHLRQRAGELLESVGLGDRLGHPPARLSGGEQQRVAIARALINHPKVVWRKSQRATWTRRPAWKCWRARCALQRTGNQTLIMVTHDPELAALADRRLHLEQLHRTEA